MIHIQRLDHLVLTVTDMDVTCNFYSQVLGMQVITFGEQRRALGFGQQKINLHQVGREFEPKSARPTSGSADLCFVTLTPIRNVIEHLNQCEVPIIAGPVQRTGALGAIESVYFRDPDGNLIEMSVYI